MEGEPVIYTRLKTALKHEKIKWVEVRNIHITLKFFGETHDEKTDDICSILDEVAARHQPF